MASRILPPGHPDYPSGLVDGADGGSPPELFVRGELPGARGVAIVGSRGATDEGLAFTRALAASLVEAGWAVWSGGARGVDAAAHEGALEAGGATVLCAPCGLDRVYPPEHRSLYERIPEAGGALLSRFPDRARPGQGSFHLRNQVLAAATRGMVVVQAGIDSGARHAASQARRLGRPLLVVPGAPWSELGAGCARELADGGAVAVASARDVLDALEAGEPAQPRRRAPRPPRQASLPLDVPAAGEPRPGPLPPDLDPRARALAEALAAGPLHVDELCERTALPPAIALAALVGLALDGVVEERAPHVYARSPC